MKKVALVLALLAATALGACGGDETTASESGDGSKVLVVVDPIGDDFEFKTESATADAGKVEFEIRNLQRGFPHNIKIEDADGNQLGGSRTILGKSDSFSLQLEPGEYFFYCSVPGHRTAGMEGPLTVE